MSKNKHHNHTTQYVVGLERDNTTNTFRVNFAEQLVKINQYKRTRKLVNARNLARKLNTSKLVIN